MGAGVVVESGFAPLSIAGGVVVLGDICDGAVLPGAAMFDSGAGVTVVDGNTVVSFFSQALNANIDNIAVITKVCFMLFLF